MSEVTGDLSGRVALVAGATRGAGRAIAVELARSGAFVYATGGSSRVSGPSDMDRPETIKETADLMAAAGGQGVGLRVDHLDAEAIRDLPALVDRLDRHRLLVWVHAHDRWAHLLHPRSSRYLVGEDGQSYFEPSNPLWSHASPRRPASRMPDESHTRETDGQPLNERASRRASRQQPGPAAAVREVNK